MRIKYFIKISLFVIFIIGMLLFYSFKTKPIFNLNNNQTTIKEELEKAKKKEKTVFLVVTSNKTNAEKLIAIANSASEYIKKAVSLNMNVNDTLNKELIEEFRLKGAILPLVIIIANNGIVVGGSNEKNATVKSLVESVPSDKMLEVITALRAGKSIFVVAYNKKAKDKKQILENCKSVSAENDSIVTIEIETDEEFDSKLIKKLNIDLKKNITTTVINSAGIITASYSTLTESKILIADTKKTVKIEDEKNKTKIKK